MSTPLVSIITVVFNGERHLEQTIASVLGQTYRDIEYLVFDGGSTDGTLEIIRRYASSLAYWVSRPDDGMFHAMNAGIRQARGELVGIINSDDWYEPAAVETAVREYLASDRRAILYGLTRYFDARGLDMILSYDHTRLPERMINHPAAFVPQAVYNAHGGFDTRYRIAADYDFMLRMYQEGVPFRHVEEILANFRHGGFSSRNSSTDEVLRIRFRRGFLTRRRYLAERLLNRARRVVGRMLPA